MRAHRRARGGDRWAGAFDGRRRSGAGSGRSRPGRDRLRDLARRARAQARRRRDASSPASSPRARCCSRTPRRAPTAPTARGSSARSTRCATTTRPSGELDAAALDPTLLAAVERHADRTRRGASTSRSSIDVDRVARALRRLVRAVPALLGRLRRRRGSCPQLAELGFDVLYLPPIHPIGRTNRKGRNNALDGRPRRSRQPVGDRRRPRAATPPSTPSSARSRTSTASSRPPREHGIEIALDFAVQCSADHPWLREHPEWFQPPPRRHAQVRREPAQALPGHLQRQLRLRGLARAVAGAARRRALLGRATACGSSASTTRTPSRSPFWEWLIEQVRAVDPRRGLPRRGVHARGDDARAGEGRLQPVLHLLHLEELALGADASTSASSPGADEREYFRPNFFVNTPDILTRVPAARRPAGVRLAARARRDAVAELRHLLGLRELRERRRGARARRSTSTPRSTRSRERALDGPLLPLLARLNEIRREHPALQRLDNVHFLETENDALIAYAKRAARRHAARRRQPRSRTTPQEGVAGRARRARPAARLRGPRPADGERFDWRIGRNYVRLDPGMRASPRAARASRSSTRAADDRRASWFESNPLWFKTAIFYEIHLRGFFDGNGDGSGDFRGLTEKLDYLEWLGIDCIWLLPMYPSPLRDGGYDIVRLHDGAPRLRHDRGRPRRSSRPPTSAASA